MTSTAYAFKNVNVQATPDYSDGDIVGSVLDFSGLGSNGGGGLLTRLQLRSLISIGVQVFVHVLAKNPSQSTVTDNGALVFHANDRSKIIKTIAVPSSSWETPKGASPWYSVELVGMGAMIPYLTFDSDGDEDGVYVIVETDGTINFASTSDLAVVVSAEVD